MNKRKEEKMKMYAVNKWTNKIEVFHDVKLSENKVCYKYEDNREYEESLDSQYYKWFETLDEAKEYLVNRINIRMESLKKELDSLFFIKSLTIALKEID